MCSSVAKRTYRNTHDDISMDNNCLIMIDSMGRMVNFSGECMFKVIFYSFVTV